MVLLGRSYENLYGKTYVIVPPFFLKNFKPRKGKGGCKISAFLDKRRYWCGFVLTTAYLEGPFSSPLWLIKKKTKENIR